MQTKENDTPYQRDLKCCSDTIGCNYFINLVLIFLLYNSTRPRSKGFRMEKTLALPNIKILSIIYIVRNVNDI